MKIEKINPEKNTVEMSSGEVFSYADLERLSHIYRRLDLKERFMCQCDNMTTEIAYALANEVLNKVSFGHNEDEAFETVKASYEDMQASLE